MSSALVLVVLIAGRDDVAGTDAAMRAARSALPSDASIVLRRVDTSPTDEEALRVERAERAAAVAVVAWSDASGRRVRLHVHRSDDGRWIDRDIAFDGADAASERGRTLGFALASMVPETVPTAASRPNAPAARPVPGVEPATPAGSSGTLLPSERADPRAALDAAALGAVGIGGYAGGVGARGGVAWLATTRVGIRVDGSLRLADVAPAQVSAFVLTVGPGVSIDLVPTTAEQRLGFGARVSALAILHSQSHLSNETEPTRQSRWLPGASGFVEGSLRLSEGAALLLSAGSEVAFGRTDVFVEGRKVAVIPPARLVGDLGIRVRFEIRAWIEGGRGTLFSR